MTTRLTQRNGKAVGHRVLESQVAWTNVVCGPVTSVPTSEALVRLARQ